MPDVIQIDERRRPRQSNFGALSSGMIVRGSVPAAVLFGAEPAPRAPTSLRDVNANVAATLAPREQTNDAPRSDLASVIALKADLAPPSPAAAGARKAVTVRLDPVHHMRLRLVGSYTRRSAQDILVQALNSYLNNLPPDIPGGGAAFKPGGAAATRDDSN